MKVRNSLLAAAVAAVAFSSASWAADNGQPAMLDTSSGPTSLTPTMFLLDPTPVGKWMESNKLFVYGFVDAGYFYDTSNPHMGANDLSGGGTTTSNGNSPTFVSFPGAFSNRGVLDQLDLTVTKTIDTTKTWDWGFLFENGYGIDDSQTHSFGVFDHRGAASAFNHPQAVGAGGATGAGTDPDNQYDILQANVSVLVPVGSGLTITAGKFVGILSEEVINPTANFFYTHSYNFFYGVPATSTGVTGSYTFAKAFNGNDVTVMGGITRGWNESTRDNNGAIDGIAEVKGNVNAKLGYVINLEEGPEGGDFDSTSGEFLSDNKDYWTTAEAIITYAYSDQLNLVGDFLYSDDPHGGVTGSGAAAGTAIDAGHSNAQWYGAALYASYKINSNFTANVRTEWYRDQGAFTTGTQANYYEATAGVEIHPFPTDNILQYLELRPEVREDWSDRAVFNASHNFNAADATGGDFTQFTMAMDVIMQF